MRILILVEVYPPSRGGIETVTQAVARAWAAAGHQVEVVTRTPAQPAADAEDTALGMRVRRGVGLRQRLASWWWADAVLHSHLSLANAGLLALLPGRTLVWLHTYIPKTGIQARLKRLILHLHRTICISDAVAEGLPVLAQRRPPCYRADLFPGSAAAPTARDRNLVFVGRLVSDKGCDLVIATVAALAAQGLPADLTIIGGGPEEPALRAQAERLGVVDRITWLGAQPPERVAAELARHHVLVTPSRWAEPFGVVPLEALACGCVPVVTSGGGMATAVGSCGIAVPNGDGAALTAAVAGLLADPGRRAALLRGAQSHCARFRPEVVAADLLNVMLSHGREAAQTS